MGISKVELGCTVLAQHAKRAEFEHVSDSTSACQLKINGDHLPVVQTGPLSFEIDHPSGYTCRFSIEEVLAALAEDLCEHATGRQRKTYSDIQIDSLSEPIDDAGTASRAAQAGLRDED